MGTSRTAQSPNYTCEILNIQFVVDPGPCSDVLAQPSTQGTQETKIARAATAAAGVQQKSSGEPEMVAGSLDLPVVGLASSDLEATAKIIRKACVECGFFYVSNHGIEDRLLGVVLAESKKFFELPLEEKMALQRNSSTHRGYAPPYAEKLDASSKFQERFSFLEGDHEAVPCNCTGYWQKDTLSNCSEFGSRC